MVLSEYALRALCCSPEEAEELASDLEQELDKEEGIPALLKELRKVLTTSLATANWLESIGEQEYANKMRSNAAIELQPQINHAMRGIADAKLALRILTGDIYTKQAADAVHELYCAAVEVAHGKRDIKGFTKRCNAFHALLDHKMHKAINEGLAPNGKGEWIELTYYNGAAYMAALKLQLSSIPACERRAALTLDAGGNEVPVDLWLWVNEARKSGLVQGLPACSLGNIDELRQIYGRARVLHNAAGGVAVSKTEKSKGKVYYDTSKHPYADGDFTSEQSYVHDETGHRVIAPFPKRPQITIKGCKRRAELSPVVEISGNGNGNGNGNM